MLFHIAMTHTVDECPGYNHDKMPELLAAGAKMEELGKKLNVKVHFLVNGMPEHVSYALVEADSPTSVAFFLADIPLRQDFKVTPVVHMHEAMDAAKAMMAQG